MMRLVAVLVVAASVVACGVSETDEDAQCRGSAEYIVPSSTLEDLVTYADEVAVVEVIDDTVQRYDEPGDGLEPELFRDATIRVEEVVWTSPQRRPVPDEVTFVANGWVDGEPQKGPSPACDQPALAVGERYLLGLVEYDTGEWAPMTGPFVLTVDDAGGLSGVVDAGPLSGYEGRSAGAVGKSLDDVEPDPAVMPYRNLPGGLRFGAAHGGD